jgi:hypothetical protein
MRKQTPGRGTSVAIDGGLHDSLEAILNFPDAHNSCGSSKREQDQHSDIRTRLGDRGYSALHTTIRLGNNSDTAAGIRGRS